MDANAEGLFPADPECINPDPDYLLLNTETGELRPAGCRRLLCPACVRMLAWRRSLAIAAAAPNLAVTLTLVAPADSAAPWQDARQGIKRWRDYMRRLGTNPGEYVAHVEPNPKGTGYHGHLWLSLPRLDFKASDAAARRAGLGFVHTERVRSSSGAAAYGLKGLAYGLKGVKGGPDSASEYLRVNGKRLTHQSRGFFGAPVRVAERLAVQAYRDAQGGSPWVLVHKS
jgi:hypothetical protein